MPKFSQKSLDKLHECQPLLQILMISAIKKTDFSVLCGHRNEADQNAAYEMGHSKLKWPNSKHNKTPSEAVDIAPYPINWTDISRFEALEKVVRQCWNEIPEEDRHGWDLVWGGSWKTFRDYPHFQIVKK